METSDIQHDESESTPFEPGTAASRIWVGMLDIYAGAVTGDRARIDANIAANCTFWDTDAMPLVHGLAELNAVRDQRPVAEPGAPTPTITAIRPEVRLWGDTAVLLHWFEWADGTGISRFRVRNTSVWRLGENGRWLMSHNHEDVMASDYWPE